MPVAVTTKDENVVFSYKLGENHILFRIGFFTCRFRKTDATAIIAAHLAGKTIAAGMFFEEQGVLFRHINLAFDFWKGNEGHLIFSSPV